MNAFNLAKAVVSKKFSKENSLPDLSLPFDSRIGSLITLKINPFIRAQGSLVGLPEKMQRVVAVSKLYVDLKGQVFRLYTSVGDDDESEKKFLQIYMDAEGRVVELVYFRRMTRIIPESSQEQDAFLGLDPNGLGQPTFCLDRQQMSELDFAPGVVDSAFTDSATELVYDRSVGADQAQFVAPFRGYENRVDDVTGATGLHQDIVFMPYQRILSGGAIEQLLISTEIVRDRNGDENDREIHVDFMVGLVLSPNDVQVQ